MKMLTRAEVGDAAWDDIVAHDRLGWFWHTSHWLRYSLAHAPGLIDHSFAVADDDASLIRAIVPLIANEAGELAFGGQVTPCPLFVGLTPELSRCTYDHACALLGRQPLPLQQRPGVTPTGQSPRGVKILTHMTQVIDLRADEADLWRGVRKSYKGLVRKAERAYDIGVYAKPWAVQHAQRIHLAAAGRATRPDETWRLMGEWTERGDAIVALAIRKVADSEMGPVVVGYAYAIRYKRWAYYASGSSLEPNLGHALQWALIKALRAGGTTHYEIGYEAGPGSNEKERGIAHFKAGFGGTPMPVTVVTPATWRSPH